MRASLRRRSALVRALIIGSASAAAAPPLAGAATVAVPPAQLAPVSVPGTTAFAATPEDIAGKAYVEHEYYASGTANRYLFPNQMADATVVDGGYVYKTRITVRRPLDPAKFNGTLVAEWYNVTLGQDIDFNWATSRDYLMRNGYAYVSISAQRVGVERLKSWSPARYGSLTVTAANTSPPDPLNTGDVLSWDIFSQAVQALRKPGAVDPLAGLDVKHVIATGESQGGRRLTQYYNSIDPLHRVVDGMVFYDPGYNTWHLLRPDNPTKVISVGSEVHSDGRPGAPVPDSANTRRWEVAGTSHLSSLDMQYVDAMTSRDMGLTRADGTPAATIQDVIPGCQYYPLWSSIPMHKVLNAAFDHVNTWMRGGPGAPAGKPLQREADGTLRHDANGRTYGGIQLAEYVYPPAFNLGYLNPGPGFCRNGGHHRFYTEAELKALYPDPHAYVRGVVETTSANLAAGYILGYDAAESVNAAYQLFDLGTADGGVGGTVPATLSLTLGAPASFGAFVPGVAAEYTASTIATVISTAGDAVLSVADASANAPGHLVNGAFSLPQPLRAGVGEPPTPVGAAGAPTPLKAYGGPVSNDVATVKFAQAIGAGDALRTGSYSKTLTFTLSTSTP